MVNGTERCFTLRAPQSEPPFIQNGQWTFQAHHVGWIVATFFTIIATVISFWLIGKHLMWYTEKQQQRYIVRLLIMVPIYATVSLASYIFWNHAIPLTLIRDSYESFVLYSFFYLLLQYLSPTIEGQKDVFRRVVLKKWMFPLGPVKYRPVDGLYFLQLMKWGVLQYCVIRPVTTMAAVILDFIGLYCADSWNPHWGHIYITVLISLSVTVAMYCLLQLYVSVSKELVRHKPLLKLFAVKAVVFLTFWQATGLSVLSMLGVVKDTKYMTADDINTGISAILETFEMMIFAGLHVRAFSYLPYRPDGHKPSDATSRFRSLMHALDIRDMWREIRNGSVYMGRTVRGVEAEEEIRKRIHFSKAMGRERELSDGRKGLKESWPIKDTRDDERLLDNADQDNRHARISRWLSEVGDKLGGDFEVEVEEELRKRQLAWDHQAQPDIERDGDAQGHTRRKGSWWRGIYERLSQGAPDREREAHPSQGAPDREREARLSPIPERPSRGHRKHHHRPSSVPSLDSPPPLPSITFEYSDLENGHSHVRLSSPHRRERFPITLDSPTEPRVDRHSHHSQHSQSFTSGTPRASRDVPRDPSAKNVIAPYPVPITRSRDVQSLVPSEHKQLPSPTVRHDDGNDFLTPVRIARSDSLLARVFADSPTSPPATFDQSPFPDGRTEPASSQDTHSTPLIYPFSLARSSLELASSSSNHKRISSPKSSPKLSTPIGTNMSSHVLSSQSPRLWDAHGPQHHSHATRSLPRPNIVLPAPLSPARYPVAAQPRGPEHFAWQPTVGNSSFQDRWTVDGPGARSADLNGTKVPSESLGPVEGRETAPGRPHYGVPVNREREMQTMKRNAPPIIDTTTSRRIAPTPAPNVQRIVSSPTENITDAMPLVTNGEIIPELPWSPNSSRLTGTSVLLTSPPSSPPSPRHLRHANGDVSTVRRPWS